MCVFNRHQMSSDIGVKDDKRNRSWAACVMAEAPTQTLTRKKAIQLTTRQQKTQKKSMPQLINNLIATRIFVAGLPEIRTRAHPTLRASERCI